MTKAILILIWWSAVAVVFLLIAFSLALDGKTIAAFFLVLASVLCVAIGVTAALKKADAEERRRRSTLGDGGE